MAASGDRLLISLLVEAREKKSFFGLGGEANVHIWGRPALDQAQQVLRLTDIQLAVDEPFALTAKLAEQTVSRPAQAEAQVGAQPPVAAPLADGRYTFDLPPQIDPGKLDVRVHPDRFERDDVLDLLRPVDDERRLPVHAAKAGGLRNRRR